MLRVTFIIHKQVPKALSAECQATTHCHSPPLNHITLSPPISSQKPSRHSQHRTVYRTRCQVGGAALGTMSRRLCKTRYHHNVIFESMCKVRSEQQVRGNWETSAGWIALVNSRRLFSMVEQAEARLWVLPLWRQLMTSSCLSD